MEIFLIFIAFFFATIVGRIVARETTKNEREETDRYCREMRTEIEAERQSMINELNEDKADFQRKKWAEQQSLKREQDAFAEREAFVERIISNLTAIPYMAHIVADYDTRELEIMAKSLDWGSNVERQKKVASLRTIRHELKDVIAASKRAEYQLAYAIQMFPGLADFLETDYNDLPSISLTDIGEGSHDASRDYLSPEEYNNLSSTERNQLALDRYLQSHRKSNWQIGRDYELFVGYKYSQKGYSVDYYGSNHGLEDLGRDLIAKNEKHTLIIQCKYWGAGKLIHENHINQLYGTMVCYCYENKLPRSAVRAVLVTNITVSDTARGFAKYLGVELVENFALGNYPCIKCNINHDEYGSTTKIYHLPFDQQYDSCKIDSPGEFFATTVAEAESAGFRRAYRWHSNETGTN